MSPEDRRQVEALLGAISVVVPTRHQGLHPNLLYLFDVGQAMRNWLREDVAPATPRRVLDADLAGDLATDLPDLVDAARDVGDAAHGWLDGEPTFPATLDAMRADYARAFEARVGELATACRATLKTLGADG